MTDPDFVDIFDPDPDFVEIVTMLRGADRPEPYLCAAAADEIEKLRKERDEARLQTGRILNEIDCRIEHGADSNGHLEAIYNLFKENNNA